MVRTSFPLVVLCVVSALTLCYGASWQQYVRAPTSETIYPHAVISTNGTVSNSNALITNQGNATLSRPSPNDTIPSITLDFGQNIVGFVQIHFAGASNNSPGIRLTFSETVEYLTNISDFTRSDNGDKITPGTDQFAVPSDPVVWTDTHGCLYNGTQVCADGLHGFRYLRIALDALATDAPHTEPNGTVHILGVNVNWYAFLGTPETYTGFFECSDTQLTQWWYDAAYTNEMCIANLTTNTTDPRNASNPELEGKLVVHDGAKRDRDPYAGDVYVSGRTTYLTHSQLSLAAKNVLGNLADNQRSDGWIPPASINNYKLPLFDYPLWWVVGSWEYILYSGDTSYAEKYFPTLINVLDNFYPSVTNKSSGLLSKGLGITEGYGDYAFLPRSGQVTYYNALYVYALKDAASWASHLSQPSASSRWNATATSVADAINTNLWDPAVDAYLDSTNLTTSENQTRHAQDGNGLAVLAGVAPPARAQQALGYISDNMSRPYGNAFYDGTVPTVDNTTDRVYAFISFFELQGRFLTTGLSASALEEINRLYGWMAAQDPQITFWEGIGPDGSPYEQGYTSMAHGWSTGIVSLLSNYVLGINPTGPGFQTWNVKPYPAGLQWATGSVRTPYGDLWASWNATTSEFNLIVSAPQGTTGTVSLPIQPGQSIYVDGHMQLNTTLGDEYAAIAEVSSGRHCFSVK